LIPGLIKWFIKNERPILRSDGSFIREWVYVEDVVNAYLLLAEAVLNKSNNFKKYNFSTGNIFKVKEVYEKLSMLFNGSYINPVYEISSHNEIPDQYLDSSRFINEFKYKSRWSFDESLNKTIDWYKDYLKN